MPNNWWTTIILALVQTVLAAIITHSIKKEGKEARVAMQAIWDYEHEKMIDNAKEVKMLISMYKE